jgi:hypothetical protein
VLPRAIRLGVMTGKTVARADLSAAVYSRVACCARKRPPALLLTLKINKDCSPNHESFTDKLYRGGYEEVKNRTLDS